MISRRPEGVQRPAGDRGGPVPLEGVFDLMRQLWELTHLLHAASKRMQARLGVTGPQRLAMRIVGMAPGLSAGTLARTLHLHPSTLTGVLRRLEERGLIRRSPDPADARRTVLHLTAEGHAQDAFRTGTLEDAVIKALDRVTASDVASARRVLGALTAALASQDPRA